MKNKKLLYVVLAIIVLAILTSVGAYFYIKNKSKNNVPKFDTEIASVIVLDINPSLKILLNKSNEVIAVIALNQDAKDIVTKEYKGKKLNETINTITKELVSKNYIKDEVTILINTTGEVNSTTVKNVILEETKNNKVECNIIIPKITESAKENAKKYNITESKASYIEDLISSYPELKIDEIKDKSINDITSTTKEIDKKRGESSNGDKSSSVNNSDKTSSTKPSNNDKKSTTKPSSTKVTPPSDPKDTSGSWCTFNKNKPYNYVYNYKGDIGMNKALEYAKAYIKNEETFFKGTESARIDEKRSSYCIGYKVMMYNDNYIYKMVVDSLTGSIIESTKTAMEKPAFSEEEAVEKGLNYFSLDRNNCDLAQAYFYMNLNKIRYSFTARCSGKYYSVNIDAKSGGILWRKHMVRIINK